MKILILQKKVALQVRKKILEKPKILLSIRFKQVEEMTNLKIRHNENYLRKE